ncbi:interleukin-17C [Myiozetetes cayanensis]|uniref:interleukin-17C n=1 Tax=Myiozetetes cayanensis TaxID=478635 RepID=UPI00215F1B8B|nr:interleukin-17C [Myiozetetes cayanensis]
MCLAHTCATVLWVEGWLGALALLGVLVLCQGLRRPGGSPHAHPVLCYSGADLGDEPPSQLLGRSLRWDRYVPVQLVPQLEQLESTRHRRHRRHHLHACPALQPRASLRSEPNERSISPWRYRIDEDENRYPRKLAFAECLCSGCVDVKTGRETTSLNSVTIHQTMMVLRRKPCPHPAGLGLVTFEVDYIKVPVGCTCVLPRTGR